MGQSCWEMLFGIPRNDTGILVAIDAEGCCRICAEVRIVLEARPVDQLVGRKSEPHQ